MPGFFMGAGSLPLPLDAGMGVPPGIVSAAGMPGFNMMPGGGAFPAPGLGGMFPGAAGSLPMGVPQGMATLPASSPLAGGGGDVAPSPPPSTAPLPTPSAHSTTSAGETVPPAASPQAAPDGSSSSPAPSPGVSDPPSKSGEGGLVVRISGGVAMPPPPPSAASSPAASASPTPSGVHPAMAGMSEREREVAQSLVGALGMDLRGRV